MPFLDSSPDEIVLETVEHLRRSDVSLLPTLDALPIALYVTDARGVVTYFNPACVRLSGRKPQAGKDRWCVTWKLYSEEGDFLPHEFCPMAEAIRQKRPIRGLSTWAERPDGTRIRFLPFPTPIFSNDGEMIGAVNLLLDVTEEGRIRDLRTKAQRCLRLALGLGDSTARARLSAMAEELAGQAAALEAEQASRMPTLDPRQSGTW